LRQLDRATLRPFWALAAGGSNFRLVVYGVPGLKVHSKIALVVRKEGEAIRRYVHLATGNYNATTARLYTDLGFLTCDEEIADDATHFFNALTGYAAKQDDRKLLVAPVGLRRAGGVDPQGNQAARGRRARTSDLQNGCAGPSTPAWRMRRRSAT